MSIQHSVLTPLFQRQGVRVAVRAVRNVVCSIYVVALSESNLRMLEKSFSQMIVIFSFTRTVQTRAMMLTSIAEVPPVLASFMDAKITNKNGINKKHDARIWVMYQMRVSC